MEQTVALVVQAAALLVMDIVAALQPQVKVTQAVQEQAFLLVYLPEVVVEQVLLVLTAFQVKVVMAELA